MEETYCTVATMISTRQLLWPGIVPTRRCLSSRLLQKGTVLGGWKGAAAALGRQDRQIDGLDNIPWLEGRWVRSKEYTRLWSA